MKQILVRDQVDVNMMEPKHSTMTSEQVTSCAEPLKRHFPHISISLSLSLNLHSVLCILPISPTLFQRQNIKAFHLAHIL